MELRRIKSTVVDAPADDTQPILAVVSNGNPDLIGDKIIAEKTDRGNGWLLDDFNSRSRIYWMHDPFKPNLGKATAWVDKGNLMLSVNFDKNDPFAADLDRKYREGFLTEWSVGFRGVEGKFDTDNESGGWTFYEQHLDEVSAVNQGMHPETRVVSKAYGEYLDAVAEAAAAINGLDTRLREIEAAIMRGEAERDEQRLLKELEDIRRIRSGV